MYTIYTASGNRVLWAPVFKTTYEARLWLDKHDSDAEERWEVDEAE